MAQTVYVRICTLARRTVTRQTSAVLQVDGAETILNKKASTQSDEFPPPKLALPSRGPVRLGLATKGRYAPPSNRVKQKADVFRVMTCPDRR